MSSSHSAQYHKCKTERPEPLRTEHWIKRFRWGKILNNPAEINIQYNSSNSSSASTSVSFVKTYSRSKEISEESWVELYFMSYTNKNSLIFFSSLMKFDFTWMFGIKCDGPTTFLIWNVASFMNIWYKTILLCICLWFLVFKF